MTIKIQILKGARYTMWNVIDVHLTVTGATVNHSDRIPTVVQGHIEWIKRVGE